MHVTQRPDASPRLARCHPSRSLSDTDRNLLAYILEELGLPPDSRMRNVRPPTTHRQQDIAETLMRPFGPDVAFLHPFGGWGLKSIPHHLGPELLAGAHAAGLRVIQIGGAADARFDGCDGAILQDFLPSQWREILSLGRALIGVDSWTAHFAAVLDMPQVTMYGSTHPRHVNTKKWFVEQESPSFVMGPTVNCSPCNSLGCKVFPDRSYCSGYTVDREAFRAFLESVRDRSSATQLV
jgi:ADP-heptose:LPS heptosyltransferase